MTPVTERNLLVALDGSERAVDTVRYLVEMPSFRRMHIHLFSVFAGVPEPYWDLEKEPSAISNTAMLRAWESQHRKRLEEHLQTCRDILTAHDVRPENIHVRIQNRKKGVARDIMAEAGKGYSALMLRRRGMTKLQKLVMGSTALKLLHGVTNTPLLFAGRRPNNPRVLIAYDGSKNGSRAVDFACAMLTPGYHSVTLASILRPLVPDELRELNVSGHTPGRVEGSDSLHRRINEAAAQFHGHGFSKSAVRVHVLEEKHSRAGRLLALAEEEGIGTIIAGRRGHSEVENFSIGRVSSKIIQLGATYAVWLVD
jgi:nucleotide-binding universal stress UspA family protein